ncbi:glycosyltransferase [Candidatus Pacearchaeota archaeon]|nr:glycosyltransferase [Candidatus Pacearchaeota archaeon]
MNFIDFAFFFYTFVGLYMISLFIFIYLSVGKAVFSYPKGKPEPVSIIVPCYNEGAHIGATIESLLRLDYPKHMIEIIVVDDKSKDNSADVVREYVKKYPNVKLIVNQKNSGGAAEPTNIGIKAAQHAYIAVTDADSTPDSDALIKMIGFLQQDASVGAVTCSVLAKNPHTFIQKLQAIEYAVIAFNRKLLDAVDSVYVTPGPFALYRKSALVEVGLFDTKNMTQDIEIVWRLLSHGYKARMCLAARVYSETPRKFTAWFKQRIRWNIGGTQTLIRYKNMMFRKGMLGLFVIPFFSFSLFLGVMGIAIFTYLWSRRFIVSYLSTKYSLYASTAVVRMSDLSFAPSILNFFGALLFLLGIWLTFFSLISMQQTKLRHANVFNVLFYLIFYLTIQPFIMITALYKLAWGRYSW